MPLDSSALAHQLDAGLPTKGTVVLFDNVPESDVLTVADALAQRRSLRLHRISARDLVAERYAVLRGNLREVFDEAHADTLLLLTDLQELITARPSMDGDEPEGPPPHERLLRYLLDRAVAFEGVVAFAVTGTPDGLDDLRAKAQVISG
jgi:hypothetical protein